MMSAAPTVEPGSLGTPRERTAFLLALLACVFVIELVFFKFIPDLGTAWYQHESSALTGWGEFQQHYLQPHSVHHARFLGNEVLEGLARFIAPWVHSSDVRLHPLRVAAGILTPVYFLVGAWPMVWLRHRVDWRVYLPTYALLFVAGLYVFYPCDAPSLATLSLGMAALLHEQFAMALGWMLITGLFRESAFHLAALFGLWAVSGPARGWGKRVTWFVLVSASFVLEYLAIRVFYPGNPQQPGLHAIDWSDIVMGRGFWSLTTVISLGLAVLFPVAFLLLDRMAQDDWRRRFFRLNAVVFPLWIVFYRIMGGNISEFRMLWPALMPFVFGLSWRSPPSGVLRDRS